MTAAATGISAPGINPYSPTAVALVSELSDSPVTVATAAVQAAYAELDAYLRAPVPEQGRRQGGVLTVLGEYGSGKTHLAAALWRRAGADDAPAAYSVYLDAPADTFVPLYQRFASLLNRYDVLEVLRDYYADVVADDLGSVPGTSDIQQRLRSGQIDPADVVQRLQLMSSALLQRLQRVLIDATSHENLATALTLLFEPSLAAAAWDWLAGNRPNEYLRERGIRHQIATDAEALDAIVAFAALYGNRGLRFVLVIDELDRVLAAASQLGTESVGAFRRALTAFEQTGGFIILVGQRDIQQTLGEEVLQRMGHIITMPPMEPDDVNELVRLSHEKTRGDADLHPFSPETLTYLTEITQGIPRQIIKLCHFLYARYQQTSLPVTIDSVRAVARDHFDVASVLDVKYEIPLVLRREGIPFSRGTVGDPTGKVVVDFWVQRADGSTRSGILVSTSVLTEADVADVRRRALAARTDEPALDVVVVIVGYLSESARAGLERIPGLDYFVYRRRTFTEELTGAVSVAVERSPATDTGDDLPVIRERIERIARQEASLHGLVEQLTAQMQASAEASERQLTALRREIADVSLRMTPAGGTTPDGAAAEPVPALLSRTEEVFEPAISALADLDRIGGVLAEALDPDPDESERMADARILVRAVLQQQDGLSPLGAASFLRQLVESFRGAIKQWYWYSDARTMGDLSATDRQRLDSLCYNYDAVFQYVPMLQLRRLLDSFQRFPSHTGLTWHTTELDTIRDQFENLSVRVRATVLEKPPSDSLA